MAVSMRIGDYIDAATGVVTNPLENPFGDSVWRSSWLYASLLVIQGKAPAVYDEIAHDHGLDVAMATTFLKYFADHGTGKDGWTVIGSTQRFSTDQLSPLLYLLECARVFGASEARAAAKVILESLLELERTGKPLSDSPSGKIRSNIGYVIDVLCDSDRYDLTYRTTDLPVFLVPCLGNIKCAHKRRRGAYKEAFSVALTAQAVGADLGEDEFSFFNSVALVTLQALAWGPGDQDVKKWRENFHHMADKKGGPAFQIASGAMPANPVVDSLKTATTCRDVDNDVVMSQRPSKFRDGTFPSPTCTTSPRTAALDYVILKGLELAWA
jgi:hypothetical protein